MQTLPQALFPFLARKVCSLPVLLGVWLVAGVCTNLYLHLTNVVLIKVIALKAAQGGIWARNPITIASYKI